MCEFVSWIEYEEHVYFLTDAELQTKAGEKLLLPNVINDLCGHGAIRAYWPELVNKGINREYTDFSSPKNFPPEITAAIKKGKMFHIGQPITLLDETARKAYNEATAQARKAYNEARAQAEKAYCEATAPAGKAYNEATAQAGKAYDEATAQARKAYDEARAQAEKAYDEARAQAEKAYCEARASLFLNFFKKNKIKSWE